MIADDVDRGDQSNTVPQDRGLDGYTSKPTQSDDWIKDLIDREDLSTDDEVAIKIAETQSRWEEFQVSASPAKRWRQFYDAAVPARGSRRMLWFAVGFIAAFPFAGLTLLLLGSSTSVPSSATAGNTAPAGQPAVAASVAAPPATAQPAPTPTPVPAAFAVASPSPLNAAPVTTPPPALPAGQTVTAAPLEPANAANAPTPAQTTPAPVTPLQLKFVFFAQGEQAGSFDRLGQSIGKALGMTVKTIALPLRSRNSGVLYFTRGDADLAHRVAQAMTQLTGQTLTTTLARTRHPAPPGAIEIDLASATSRAIARQGF